MANATKSTPFQWVCEFCFRTVETNVLPDDWKLVWQSAVCPKCQPRVEKDGGYEVVCGGSYAGDRRDPRAKDQDYKHLPHPRARISVEFRKCTLCDDLEPFHAHLNGERIDDYFVIGRCSSDLNAAEVWRVRALEAEKRLKEKETAQ